MSNTEMRSLALYAIVGGFGMVINSLILYMLTAFAGMHYILASIVATETAIISNFFGNNYITFQGRNNKLSVWQRLVRFQVVSLLSLCITVGALAALATFFGIAYLIVWNVIAIGTAFVFNYVLNTKITWRNNTKEVG